MPASLSQFIGDIREKRRLREQEEMRKVIPYIDAFGQALQQEEEQRQDLKFANIHEKYLFGEEAAEVTAEMVSLKGGAEAFSLYQKQKHETQVLAQYLPEGFTGTLAEKEFAVKEVKKETKLFEKQKEITYKDLKSARKESMKLGLPQTGTLTEMNARITEHYKVKLAPKEKVPTFRTINGNIWKYNEATDKWDISLSRIGRDKGKTPEEKRLIGKYNAVLTKLSKYPKEPERLNKAGEVTRKWIAWDELQNALIESTALMESFELFAEKPKQVEKTKDVEQLQRYSDALNQEGDILTVKVYNEKTSEWKTEKLTREEVIKRVGLIKPKKPEKKEVEFKGKDPLGLFK